MVVIAGFAGRLPDDVGGAALRKAKAAADAEHLHSRGRAESSPGERHYYRIQAPGLLIEHDNTQAAGSTSTRSGATRTTTSATTCWRTITGTWVDAIRLGLAGRRRNP